MTGDFARELAALKRRFRGGLWLAAAMASGVSVAAVALLGVSGWFLVAAAGAGAAGTVAAQGFNYLLPSALIRFLAIARTGLRYGERLVGHDTALRAMAELRPALFGRLVAMPAEAALKLGRGEASGRLVQDVAALENGLVLDSVPPASLAGMATALILAGLGAWPAAVALLLALIIGWLGGWWLYRRLPAPVADEGEVKARFHEMLALVDDVRTNDPGAGLDAALDRAEDRLMAARSGGVSREAAIQTWVLAMTGIGLAVITLAGSDAPAPGMALALLAGAMGFESLGSWLRVVGTRETIAAAEVRLAGVYDAGVEAPTPPAAETPWFAHGGRRFALDGSLRLRLDGPSGRGKTRLIEGLIGLRTVLDLEGPFGRDLFALSPQDAAMLTGTVRHNLLMAGAGLSDDVLWQALDDAGLAARVRGMARGLDSWIGDGGITLSGGERKRLGLARAYLREAPVLLLDEPTEGLDAATEAFVVERLAARLARTGQGLILVSHREPPRRLAFEVLKV